MKFTRQARYNGSSRSKRIAFCSHEPRVRQFRSQAACERCATRIYPRATRHKSGLFHRSRVYVPKRVMKIRLQLPAVRLSSKRSKDLMIWRSWITERKSEFIKMQRNQSFRYLNIYSDVMQRYFGVNRYKKHLLFIYFDVRVYREQAWCTCKYIQSKDLKI